MTSLGASDASGSHRCEAPWMPRYTSRLQLLLGCIRLLAPLGEEPSQASPSSGPQQACPMRTLSPLSSALSLSFTELPRLLMTSPCLARTPRSRRHVGRTAWMGRTAVKGNSRRSLPRCEHIRKTCSIATARSLPVLGPRPTLLSSRFPWSLRSYILCTQPVSWPSFFYICHTRNLI